MAAWPEWRTATITTDRDTSRVASVGNDGRRHRGPSPGQRLALALQRALPQRALGALAGRIADSRWPPLRRALIRAFVRRYGVDLSEAAEPDPEAYPCFNAFFTRALRPGARPLADGEATAVSPVDGTLAEIGPVRAGLTLGVKGRGYSLAALLGDTGAARAFAGGAYANLYLAPRDYHRVHMPLAGTLRAARHLPGSLLSVAPAIAAQMPDLPARNERLALRFDTAWGPMAVVMVGALLVGGIETVWGGRLGHTRRPRELAVPAGLTLARGAELGRFRMGSTVVVLWAHPPAWAPGLAPGTRVRMGQALGGMPGSGAQAAP